MSETQDTTATTSSAAAPAPVAQPQQQQPAQQQQQQQSAPAQSQPQPQQQTTDQSSNVAPQAQAQAAVGVPQATTSAPTTTAHNGNTTQTQTQAQTSDQSLVCMWQGCSERLPTPEALYEHVCERHVGRKSTNNLNLTCQWGNCRTTTVKRDHITSHIRVHVPLKPHKCDFCGKAFKRPQDLKKHVKTHADDSVLVRSPEPRNPDVVFGVPGNAKGCPPAGHYFEPGLNPVPGQGYHAAPQYYQSQQPQQPPSNPSYGNVYYTLNHGSDANQQASYESRKRGYDALNEFFGDLKRRQFDPTSYTAVGQRLLGLHGLQLPLINSPVPDYQQIPAAVAVGGPGGYSSGGPIPAQGYHLPPMSNARTKSDLINIDQFLEQMQATVYESDDHVAAAGVAQPGATYVHGGMSYRTTNSPPTQLPSSHATATTTSAPMMATTSSAHSPSSATPALTPPSSAQSYTSGRSPVSLPSTHRVSPSQSETSTGMYPRLLSTTVQDGMSAGYPTTSSAAPPSTLGGIFDNDGSRRYTGGTLQRARPDDRQLSEDMDVSEDSARTPHTKERATDSPGRISASLIDPALHRSTSPDPETALRAAQVATEATEAADRAEEQWVEHVRLIENLRKYIHWRLEHGDYEEDDEERPAASPRPDPGRTGHDGHMEGVEREKEAKPVDAPVKTEPSGGSLYPTLRGVDDGDSKMADAGA